MAYYTSNFHQDDAATGEYNFNPYDVVPDQDSVNYSWYESSESNSTDYHSNSCYEVYDSIGTRSHSFTHHFSEPKFIQYEPAPHDSGYFNPETHYIISYSTAEFNEPEFEEYDPTPYGGGYDITQTYGKPLPPSDETCYSRSTPIPNSLPLNGLSIPSTYGKPDTDFKEAKPQTQSKEGDAGKEVQKGNDQIPAAGVPIKQHGEGDKQDLEKPLDSKESEERKENTNGGGHELPDSDSDDGNGSGKNGAYGYEYDDKQVVQYPYGYGLEALDLCESIFGYWPCLAKQIRNNNCNGGGDRDKGSSYNPWQGAADYIFGSPYDGHGQRLYGYSWYDQESYYHQPPYYRQDKCDENSWKHDFNIF